MTTTDAKDRFLELEQRVRFLAESQGRDPADLTLVCVSKTHNWQEIEPVYQAGCRNFGENRVEEALEKMEHAPTTINWHFIGTLQKNKVNKILGKFSLIHSVDQYDLAKKISDASLQNQLTTQVLLQVNTSGETTKHGLSTDEWMPHIDNLFNLPGIRIQGLMTMAPLTDDKALIHKTFADLRLFKEKLELITQHSLPHLSMGMTNDYPIAIEEGATLLRIGSAIFN